MFDSLHEIKIVKVLLHDSMKLMGDITVNYQYCEMGNILNQYKEMASLDYSSLAKNLSNQIMVIWKDQPEMRSEILKLKDAAQCLS